LQTFDGVKFNYESTRDFRVLNYDREVRKMLKLPLEEKDNEYIRQKLIESYKDGVFEGAGFRSGAENMYYALNLLDIIGA